MIRVFCFKIDFEYEGKSIIKIGLFVVFIQGKQWILMIAWENALPWTEVL